MKPEQPAHSPHHGWAVAGVTFLVLLAGAAIPVFAQNKPQARLIVSAKADTKSSPGSSLHDPTLDGPGPLRITYTDGTTESVPADEDANPSGMERLVQKFSSVTISPDRKTVAWEPIYSGICAQNYPCPLDLFFYRSGHPLLRIPSTYGDLWSWRFLSNGERIATLSGFPHGDDVGEAALYDTATGNQLATFKGQGEEPSWAREAFPTAFRDH